MTTNADSTATPPVAPLPATSTDEAPVSRLRMAISPCPNDTFTFDALVHGRVVGAEPVELVWADVDEANQLAVDGLLDVAKVSYGALPWLLDDHVLLPCGGALGRGCGPLVLTRDGRGPDALTGARVAVPGERTTAYLLMRLWAAEAVPGAIGDIVVLPFEQIMPAVRDGRVDAGLVIHESRFTFPSFGLTQIADLGDWWEADTGLPIPLGAIVARRTLGAERVERLADAITASVRSGWSDPRASDDFVAAHAQEMDPSVCAAHIELYVTEHTARLDDEGYRAVATLLDRAAAAGLTPAVPAHALTPLPVIPGPGPARPAGRRPA